MTMQPEVIELLKNVDAHQYEIHFEGQQAGFVTFLERGDVVVLLHTETAPAYGGRGLAAKLVAFALDDIRAQDRKVDSRCSYVDSFIKRNPEYADLIAGSE